jgi:putative ABC transport system permease protein
VIRRRSRVVPERASFPFRDMASEALAGVLQRPGRSVLTMLGTVLGVGAFVAVLGLTSTAGGQITQHFNALRETTVTVTDVGSGEDAPTEDGAQASTDAAPVDFPSDSDARITALNGAVAAGVYWTVPLHGQSVSTVRSGPRDDSANSAGVTVFAASPGLFGVMHPTLSTGLLFNSFHERRGEPVALLGAAAAARLGISQLSAQPAVFIGNKAFTVIGILKTTQRLPELQLGIILPRSTAEQIYGPPDPLTNPAQMVIETKLGAAALIAHQAPLALRPDQPTYLEAAAPPDPHSLLDSVNTDLSVLFLALAAICLVIGTIGITNTTLVAVLERVGEIGLRRALGARRRHIALQFICESTTLGTLGGLIGTALGVAVVLTVALTKHWSAIIDPLAVLPSPLIGTVVGMLAGLYPAVRAATIEPLEALRR